MTELTIDAEYVLTSQGRRVHRRYPETRSSTLCGQVVARVAAIEESQPQCLRCQQFDV